jgi:hypothetical protein
LDLQINVNLGGAVEKKLMNSQFARDVNVITAQSAKGVNDAGAEQTKR